MSNTRRRNVTPHNVDARALIAHLNQAGREVLSREIIAPLLPGGRMRTRVAGLIYEFKVRERFTGWGRFRPLNEREAEVLSEALPWERGGYLERFPALRVVLLWPQSGARAPGTWLALPYNESDARQRFNFATEPLPVFLCDPTDGAQPFERVIARVDGRTLWFEGPDVLADPAHAQWLRDACEREGGEGFLPGLAQSQRLALLYWHIRQLEISSPTGTSRAQQTLPHGRQQEWLEQHARHMSLEQSLRHALAKADATLHSFSDISAPGGAHSQFLIEWSEHGHTRRYRSVVDPQLTIVSSGICLSGRDRDFDLTSLVGVLADAYW